MKLIDFIKLIMQHKVVLILIPLFFGLLAVIFTTNPTRNYYSQTTLYTGIASGSSIDMDKKFNYLATNNAFDNLINIIKSREAQEEVAIRLLSQHLMLNGPNEKYISEELYNELLDILPEDINSLVVKSSKNFFIQKSKDNLSESDPWNNSDYETTVRNLMEYMSSDNENFIYSLLNFDSPHYSLEAISEVKAERMSTSDLIKLSYETNDPGICQQTLRIYNQVCINKYKFLKENGSDAVVKYFESQLQIADNKLKAIEQRLLKFNQENNIINYYEQSKAVSIVKEELDVAYNQSLAKLAGSQASTKRLEQKLEIQELVQEKNNEVIYSKKQLGELNYKIGMMEAKSSNSDSSIDNLDNLKEQADELQKQLKTKVDELYSFQNSTDGIPIKKTLPDWVDKIVETEDLKAKLQVMDNYNDIVQRQFATYAPAGANLKRLEREIDVAEQEYLEILHGLNLAKLKLQDTQLSSNLKAVDSPFFPLKPIASKRKIVISAIVFISGIFVLGIILLMEFFDETLKNIKVSSNKLKLSSMGMFVKILKPKSKLDLIQVQDRLMDFLMHNFNHGFYKSKSNEVKVITVISTRAQEGKTTIINNLASKLVESGNKVLVLNHSSEKNKKINKTRTTWLHKVLGYQDPRIDYSHPFLSNDEAKAYNSLTYSRNSSFQNVKHYNDLNFDNTRVQNEYLDYVIIELPNLLEMNYPADLVTTSDLVLLVCRSNRLWSKADDNLLNNIKELTESKVQFILNGVELREVESLLGELPKNGSKTRIKVKNILRFHFYNNNTI